MTDNNPEPVKRNDASVDEDDIIIMVEDEEVIVLPPAPPAPMAPPAPPAPEEACESGGYEHEMEDMAPSGLAGGTQTDDY